MQSFIASPHASPRRPIHRSPLNRSLVLLGVALGVILLGCAAATRHAKPATTQSAAPRTLNLADSLPIARYREEDHEIDLKNVIGFTGKRGDVYFGQSDTYDENGDPSSTVPLIVAISKGAWGALSVKDDRLPDAEWQFVASGPADGEVWGVLDDSINHAGKAILLAHSTDSAATWNITAVHKPFDAGDYDSFAMDKSGHGRLTVYLAPGRKHPNRSGFYHFRTSDAGKTWSAPEHEADALDPADEVPADEDPPPLQTAPLQSASLSPARKGPG
jgi:hypothetical protein